MRAMKGLDDYLSLLQAFHGFIGGLEKNINRYIGIRELPDYLERRKSESLANDIRSLKGALPYDASETDLPEVNNYLQAFGAMYVMEGSTLGGQIISKMLIQQLGLEKNEVSFFQSYDEHLTSMWNSFKGILNRQADTDAEAEQIIGAAQSTFESLKNWLDKN